MSDETAAANPPADAVWRWHEHRDFMLNCGSRFAVTLGTQVQTLAIGWYVYDTTGSAAALGGVGLAAFLPAVALMLVTGYASDRYDRRLVLTLCCATMSIAALGQLLLVAGNSSVLWLLYLTVLVHGAGRAFYLPANSSVLPNLVPRRHFANAVAFSTAVSQAANISGPAVGGVLYAISPNYAFAAALALYALGALCNFAISYRNEPARTSAGSLDELFAGFRYMWSKEVILGALTLDLLVVVLGGAVSLLPIFAKDILHVGPDGMGLLRSAPAAGALLMGVVLARRNFMERKAGSRMILSVIVFGLANLGFGLSESFALSFLFLAILGAADTASVVVRMTLVQAETPDELRGRVAAVSSLCTSFSNEIGQFRAGTMAEGIGAVPATVIGGLGAITIAVLWQRLFPALGRRDHLVPPERPPA